MNDIGSRSEDRKQRANAWFETLRGRICAEFEALEDEYAGPLAGPPANRPAGRFERKPWQRPDETGGMGGGGTMAIMRGRLFEKVGVNVSTVHGTFSEEFRKQIPGAAEDGGFWASGISLVAHMQSPKVPAVHMNTRYIVTRQAWFGGGADLTPYYLFRDDAVHFHRTLADACDRHREVADYDRFKAWCDDYFFLPHRHEARGVGGIFFDYIGKDLTDLEPVLDFVADCGRAFLAAYLPIVERRKAEPYGEAERTWQLRRRGRYVEFNLLYDRGTIFGLKTGGRVESILMSLPLNVRWEYDFRPEPGSPEAELYDVYLKPRDWADERGGRHAAAGRPDHGLAVRLGHAVARRQDARRAGRAVRGPRGVRPPHARPAVRVRRRR